MDKDESTNVNSYISGYATAESRWARFGPYYAMFPMNFAYEVIARHSKKGDFVLDPFSGRGSSLFAAASLGRVGHGVEINPVGWIYSKTKLSPAPIEQVKKRLIDIVNSAKKTDIDKNDCPEFYSYCFSHNVMKFLLYAKETLDWELNSIDTTLMAFILHYLHGKKEQSLSNQMSMIKAMSPNYSIDWWLKKGFCTPPEIDVLSFFEKRLQWRYNKGTVAFQDSKVVLGDSSVKLNDLQNDMTDKCKKYSLLFTSPPYQGVTNYFTDQWLRYWMLGGPNHPRTNKNKHKKRFNSESEYEALLNDVFLSCKKLLMPNATIYVRTDSRKFTFTVTKKILQQHFPNYLAVQLDSKCKIMSQTELYRNSTNKPHEIDIVLTPYNH